ncbi:hypothetical protein [Devosia sp. SL43]|nr:hypothetical protein [Devosia sp. SL43]UJW87060.1 hypothetical protein IM737_07415 [Devosia sp. SL43]
MEHFTAHNGVAPHAWLQHHLPWLALFTLVMSLFRDEPVIGFDPDDLNG